MSTLDYMKPDLSKPLAKSDLTVLNMAEPEKKAAPLKGFQHFMKVRVKLQFALTFSFVHKNYLILGAKNYRRDV